MTLLGTYLPTGYCKFYFKGTYVSASVVDPDPVGSGIILQDPDPELLISDPELLISDPDPTNMTQMA